MCGVERERKEMGLSLYVGEYFFQIEVQVKLTIYFFIDIEMM